jgi:tetraacyldisaccharide 4'-kinase
MKWLRKLLFPFSLIYGGLVFLRNKFYDWNWKKSEKFDFPVIVVGNLSTGGTGKSPMVEYLLKFLKQDYSVASLSRGYKRKTKGFHELKGNETADLTGDEPLQFKTKFPDVAVAVGENRREGIQKLRQTDPKPEIIVLDDAFQHRKVSAGFSILLTTFVDLYCDDLILPAGNLRENRSGAKRADFIVVTKCPKNLGEGEKNKIRKRLSLKPHQELFFSHIEYANEVCFADAKRNLTDLKDFTLVTGIANPKPLKTHLKNLSLNFKHLKFPDHHSFTPKEIQKLAREKLILTTEKDFMRLKNEASLKGKLGYLPIEIELDRGSEFQKTITSFIENDLKAGF